MTTSKVASTITAARERLGINQSELGRRLNVSPQAVQAWESGRSIPRPKKLIEISRALEIPDHVLLKASGLLVGTVPEIIERFGLADPAIPKVEAVVDGRMIPWDVGTPLDSEDVFVPFLSEVETPAGSGRTSIERSEQRKIRFSKNELITLGVELDKAICVTVQGDAMSPLLPDGSIVAVDMGSTVVRDGKMYAINQSGHLRIKTLHRLPGGGVRLRSFNREYMDEEYTLEEMDQRDISIIGRVFWSSVIW